MQISLTAGGTPEQVKLSLNQQLKNIAAEEQKKVGGQPSWPALVSCRDYVTKALEGAGATDQVSLSVALSIAVQITPAVASAPVTKAAAEPKAAVAKD
jgi:hypothetical protein